MKLGRTQAKIISILIFVSSRLYLVLNENIIYDYYDSIYYFNFELFNSFRLPIITLIYSSLQNYTSIVIFQSIFSSLCWVLLIYVGNNLFNYRASKLIFSSTLIFFSYSQIILIRDFHILSESLTLSTSILLFASTLNLKSNNYMSNLYFILSLLLFSGIKSASSVAGLSILLIYVLYLIVTQKNQIKNLKLLIPIVLTSFLMLNFVHSTLSSNISAQLNTSALINFRLWGNESWKDYLLDSRYPPELRTIWRDRQEYNLGQTPDQGVINESIYQKWWNEGGNAFLVRFMIDHPIYTFAGPFILPELNSRTDYSYTLIHAWAQDPRVNPELIKFDLPTNLLWQEERLLAYASVVVFLSIIGIYFFVSQLRISSFDSAISFRLFAVLIVIFFWSYFSWWFGSKPGGDILRHQEMPAVILRIVFIICLIQFIDAKVKSRKTLEGNDSNMLGH